MMTNTENMETGFVNNVRMHSKIISEKTKEIINSSFLPSGIKTLLTPTSIILVFAFVISSVSIIFLYLEKRIESFVFVILVGAIVAFFIFLNVVRTILKGVNAFLKRLWVGFH